MFLKTIYYQYRRVFRRTGFCQLLLISLLAQACAPEPELLNSERIEDRFGSYGIRILYADEQKRITSLYTEETAGEVSRTVAIVDFIRPLDVRLADEHSLVVAGGSIGEVFRQAGWETRKKTLFIRQGFSGEFNVEIAGRMQLDPAFPLAVHRYRFDVVRGTLRIPYAVITEVHHPDYLTVQQVHEIYD